MTVRSGRTPARVDEVWARATPTANPNQRTNKPTKVPTLPTLPTTLEGPAGTCRQRTATCTWGLKQTATHRYETPFVRGRLPWRKTKPIDAAEDDVRPVWQGGAHQPGWPGYYNEHYCTRNYDDCRRRCRRRGCRPRRRRPTTELCHHAITGRHADNVGTTSCCTAGVATVGRRRQRSHY